MDLSRLSTPFVVVGAIATRLYMPERLTGDLDILIHQRDSRRLETELVSMGFTLDARLSLGGTSWIAANGDRLDVLALDAPWVTDALIRPNRSPDGLPVVALPYLVLLKMNASRGIDIGDLTRMLGLADEKARDEVREVIRTYQREDLDDLESLIVLGDLEFGGFRATDH